MATNQNNGGRQDARLDNLEKAVDKLEKTVENQWAAHSDQRDRITSLKGTLVAVIVISNLASGLLARWFFQS